jgi:predicted CopG family antitoxin
MAKKRIQSGKVVRLGEDVIEKLEPQRKDRESWSKFLVRLLEKLEGKSYWLVPSAKKVFESKKKAAGFAVLDAVSKGKDKPESPVRVREDG